LIVASLPVTPVPAVAGPGTGGQYVVHEPLQFDFVDVSGTNQYKVRPLAFVSTATPPIVVVFRAALVVAEPDADGADELAGDEVAGAAGADDDDDDDELLHPAARSATAARPAADHRQPRACFPGGRTVACLTLCANAMASPVLGLEPPTGSERRS
jgi:hypothetical protein